MIFSSIEAKFASIAPAMVKNFNDALKERGQEINSEGSSFQMALLVSSQDLHPGLSVQQVLLCLEPRTVAGGAKRREIP